MTQQQIAETPEVIEPQPPVVEQPTEQVAPAPAAPPVAAAPETPAPAPVAVPVAPAPPAVDPRMAEYITGLERQNRETQTKLDQEEAVTAIARRQEEFVAAGLEPAQAQAIATEIIQARQQAQTQVSEMRAKVLYAGQLSDQHKVPVASLMQYETPEAMRGAVEKIAAEGSQAAELARLKAEVASLKKGQVPAQSFDSGRTAGAPVATADNIDKLYMDWERERPTQPNPYAAKYQQFLSTGTLA